jgi:hypothetical protein
MGAQWYHRYAEALPDRLPDPYRLLRDHVPDTRLHVGQYPLQDLAEGSRNSPSTANALRGMEAEAEGDSEVSQKGRG